MSSLRSGMSPLPRRPCLVEGGESYASMGCDFAPAFAVKEK